LGSIYFRFAAPDGGALERAPRLERLLARASALGPVSDWRADAFRCLAGQGPAPAPAPAVLVAACGAVPGASAVLATPVHCVVGTSNVRLATDGVLRLGAVQASALAVDFNRVFGGSEPRLLALPSGALLAVFDRYLQCDSVDPETLRGRDIAGHLPSGSDGPALRGLMSEIEMWLFDHPVNRVRLAAGEAPITGLWLWGQGALLSSLPPFPAWVAGDDAVFSAWAAGPPVGALTSAGLLAFGSVRPGSAAWGPVERDWLLPAIAALDSGRIARLDLSAGTQRFAASARSWRFWRRTHPWWHYFDEEIGR